MSAMLVVKPIAPEMHEKQPLDAWLKDAMRFMPNLKCEIHPVSGCVHVFGLLLELCVFIKVYERDIKKLFERRPDIRAAFVANNPAADMNNPLKFVKDKKLKLASGEFTFTEGFNPLEM
jgi:hypothetical protein